MENTYRVIAKAKCDVCENTWIVDTSDIHAQREDEAVRKMKEQYKLCPSCLKTGTKAATTFADFITVNRLPGSGVE
jgi:hypothetical protein